MQAKVQGLYLSNIIHGRIKLMMEVEERALGFEFTISTGNKCLRRLKSAITDLLTKENISGLYDQGLLYHL